MAFRWLLTVNILAIIFLGAAFLLGLALWRIMGKGKDTAPLKILLLVIALNVSLGLTLLAGCWFEYFQQWINYARITDVALMLIGLFLTVGLAKVYFDYKKLIKKHEPSA